MRKGKVTVYPCFGGLLDGLVVTAEYAGPEYVQYNSATGSHWFLTKRNKETGERTFERKASAILIFKGEVTETKIVPKR